MMKNDVSHADKLLKPIFPNLRKKIQMLDSENPRSGKFSTITFGSKGIYPGNISQIGKKRCL